MNKEDINETLNQIKGMKAAFKNYNSAKINSLYESLATPELINLFNFIPFLFTVNQPEFPGYMKEIRIPHGIDNYQIPPKLLSQLRISNPSFAQPKTREFEPLIRLFALIGSSPRIDRNST